MFLYEYQGKQLFKKSGIPVPEGKVVSDADEALAAAEALGYPVMVKAQVRHGGRGKAGLVRKADCAAKVMEACGVIKAYKADAPILVEKCADTVAEGYIGITVDDVAGCSVMVMSAGGGIDVEANSKAGRVAKCRIDPMNGISDEELNALAVKAGFCEDHIAGAVWMAKKLHECYVTFEADTMEINPVIFIEGGGVTAGDSKVISDDYADFRQPEIDGFVRESNAGAVLNADHFAFVRLDGNIGVISVGASNTMMLLDTIDRMGGRAANFMDAMGRNSFDDIVDAYVTLLETFEREDIPAVIINFTLTAQSLRNYAGAVAEAMNRVKLTKRYVACIRAVGAAVYEMTLEEGKKVLADHGVEVIDSLHDAIARVVELSKEA